MLLLNHLINKLDFHQLVKQADFKKGISTEQNVPLQLSMVDIQKAFDTMFSVRII